MMRRLSVFAIFAVACSSSTPQPWLLDELTADTGMWFRTPSFDVPSGSEIQNCYFFQVPDLDNGNDLWIDHTTLGLNPGSHHMNVFRVKTIVNLDPADGVPVDMGSVQGTEIDGETNTACWTSSNWSDWPLVANSQQSAAGAQILDWQFPDNVAERFTPGEMLMLQIHYVNSTDQVTPWVGRAGINLYRTEDTSSTMELGTLFATDQRIRVCQSDPTPEYSATCAMPAGDYTVIASNGHFHSRGTDFRMFTWDGTSTTMPDASAMFYNNTNWSEPLMAKSLDVTLPQAGGIWYTCDYQWSLPSVGCDVVNARDPLQQNDCCYTFGPIVESSEHCNAFVYYYPAVDSGSITCQ